MTWIMAIALLLRLIFIGQSLWLDEAIEALALMGKQGPLLTYALGDYQPPLYHFIGYLFTHLFGYSELVLRLPSLISGILTVYFLIKIGEYLASKQVGLVAGILAATNPLLIYYSVEGRTYAMTTFFVTASFYYFLRLLKTKNLKFSVLYSLFTILFIWTSYLSWFVLLVQGLYVLYKKRYDIFILQVGSALTLLAWVPSFLSSLRIGQSTMGGSPEWGKVVGGLNWKSLPLTWVKFVIGRIGFDNKILYALIVSFIALLHLSALRLLNFKKHHLLLLWLIAPVILGLFTATILPVYSYFRVLFVLPAYLLLLSLAISESKSKLIFPLIITVQLLAVAYYGFSPRYHHEDWRTLVKDLPATAQLAIPSRAQQAPLLYYGWQSPIIEPNHESLVGSKIYYVRYAEDIFDSARLGQANFRDSGYTITSQQVYPGIQVDIYENSH